MKRRWTRPLLCRLCRCPVADGGVPLSRLDRPKLSKWWLKHLDTQFDDEEPEKDAICQFCIWDARLEHESSEYDQGHGGCDWWKCPGEVEDPNYKYYFDHLIRACSVKIAILDIFNCFKCQISFSNQEDKNQHNAIFHRKFQCIYCNEHKLFTSFNGLDYHIKNQHQAEKIQCNFNSRCTIYFKTEEDKQKHIVQVHQSKTKCVYCKKTINNLSRHVKELHGNEAIKCNFHQACPTYFLSIEEREKHILEDHKTTTKFCIYCKKKFTDLGRHVRSHHKSEAIKCNYNKKCCFFFRTEQERRKHIEKVHEKKAGKLLKCIYCRKMTSTLSRHVHIHHKQEAIKCSFNCNTFFLFPRGQTKTRRSSPREKKHGPVHLLRENVARKTMAAHQNMPQRRRYQVQLF